MDAFARQRSFARPYGEDGSCPAVLGNQCHCRLTDKIRTQVREAYKILRPEGRNRGTVWVYLNSRRKVKSLHGWCIPAQGADFEVKDKDSSEMSPPMIAGIELVQDVKVRVLHIPAPDPGNIVGY